MYFEEHLYNGSCSVTLYYILPLTLIVISDFHQNLPHPVIPKPFIPVEQIFAIQRDTYTHVLILTEASINYI